MQPLTVYQIQDIIRKDWDKKELKSEHLDQEGGSS